MPRVYSSRELHRTVAAVSDFIEAAEAYAEDQGDDQLQNAVAEAAGRAGDASGMAGLVVTQDIPGRGRITYDPIRAWNAQLDPFGDTLVEAISHARQVKGVLERMAEDATSEERSLVGWVARFVGFPGRVRRHLEDRGYSQGAQTAGFALSIAVQVVGGLILLWLGYLIGWA